MAVKIMCFTIILLHILMKFTHVQPIRYSEAQRRDIKKIKNNHRLDFGIVWKNKDRNADISDNT